MKVYVITTKCIGEEYIFNLRNRNIITEDRRPDNIRFNDLQYVVDNNTPINYSHQYYYEFGDDECRIIGIAFLPNNPNNNNRIEEWRNWLMTLCHGDEYIFVLHDKDYTQEDTPFKRIDGNTYVFLHEHEDWFYGLLENIGSNIEASNFDKKFNKLVSFAEFRQRINEYIKNLPNNLGIDFFQEIDNLLLSTEKKYERRYQIVNNDQESIRRMLVEIRREINKRKYE